MKDILEMSGVIKNINLKTCYVSFAESFRIKIDFR